VIEGKAEPARPDRPYYIPPAHGIYHTGIAGANFMEMNHYFLKLIGPRPDFAATMTGEEKQVMQEHGAYLKGYVDNGTVIVMGPVLDPAGAWGMAVVEAGSEDEVRTIIAKDPTVLSGLGFRWEIYPMLRAVVRK
jgi:uncharacterized protein YciI